MDINNINLNNKDINIKDYENKYCINNIDKEQLEKYYNNNIKCDQCNCCINNQEIHSLDFDLNNLTDTEYNSIPKYNLIDEENDDLSVQEAKKVAIQNQLNK